MSKILNIVITNLFALVIIISLLNYFTSLFKDYFEMFISFLFQLKKGTHNLNPYQNIKFPNMMKVYFSKFLF